MVGLDWDKPELWENCFLFKMCPRGAEVRQLLYNVRANTDMSTPETVEHSRFRVQSH